VAAVVSACGILLMAVVAVFCFYKGEETAKKRIRDEQDFRKKAYSKEPVPHDIAEVAETERNLHTAQSNLKDQVPLNLLPTITEGNDANTIEAD